MNRWGHFYKSLYDGSKKPETHEQLEFIQNVKKGIATNDHERAFLAWLKPKNQEKNKKHTGTVPAPRPPRKKTKSSNLTWMSKKPVKIQPLPQAPPPKVEEKKKVNYDALATGKAHGDKKLRLKGQKLDRWGRPI